MCTLLLNTDSLDYVCSGLHKQLSTPAGGIYCLDLSVGIWAQRERWREVEEEEEGEEEVLVEQKQPQWIYGNAESIGPRQSAPVDPRCVCVCVYVYTIYIYICL